MPNKKDPEGSNLLNGAGSSILLQPLVPIILQELKKIPIEEMLLYA